VIHSGVAGYSAEEKYWYLTTCRFPFMSAFIDHVFNFMCLRIMTPREERRLRVFENRVLRRIFGLKWDEVTGEWKKLHNEELDDLYYSPNTIWVIKLRRMRLAGHVARMGERRGVYSVLVGKPEGKRPLGRHA
jgi:hypothetical protein